MNVENEVSDIDRLYYLVTELLEGGSDPRDIKDTVREATLEWATRKRESHTVTPD